MLHVKRCNVGLVLMVRQSQVHRLAYRPGMRTWYYFETAILKNLDAILS